MPGFPPSQYVVSTLAQLIDPAEVIFSDWSSAESPDVDVSSGAMFALTCGNAVKVSWVDVPTDMHIMSGRAEPHSIDVVLHPLLKPPAIRLHVTNVHADLRSTPSGSVTLEGNSWSQALPFNKHYNQRLAEYFQEIRTAVSAAITG